MKNKIWLGFLFLTLVMFSTFMVSAVYVANGVTFVNPLASGTVTGTQVLNVTNSSGLFNQLVNCTFYAKSASTANSSWTLIKESTANNTLYNVNTTFVSTILEDSNDYVFNATCRNKTNDQTDRTITGVIIDNTTPTAPTSLDPATGTSRTSAGTITFTSTVVDRETTSCTYAISKGDTDTGSDYITGTGTYSVGTCSFTKAFSTSADGGNWYWKTIASDGTQTTTSAKNVYTVAIPSNGNLAVAQANQKAQVTTQGGILGGITSNPILIIVIVVIVFLIFNQKKR